MANLDIERVLGDKSPGQIICRQPRGCLNNVEIQGFPRGYVVGWNLFQGHDATGKGSVMVARIFNNLSWSAS